ncbi:MAG: WecB/TagA/CpsF family glycosyltransferase [Fimbriimonadaceae bacterium]
MLATNAAVANFDRPRVLGIPIDAVPMDDALRVMEQFLVGTTPRQVVTADSSMLTAAYKDEALRAVMMRADFVTPDSEGVIWALSRKTKLNYQRVTGVELVDRLSGICAERGHSVFYFGSGDGVAEEAAKELGRRYPGLQVAGAMNGFYKPEEEASIAEQIAAAKPDLLFVALGQPKQEMFIDRYKDLIGAKIAMGVGGSFDVISGRVKRAPKWVRRIRMEWFWRSGLNPKKHSKLKSLPVFVQLVLTDKS